MYAHCESSPSPLSLPQEMYAANVTSSADLNVFG